MKLKYTYDPFFNTLKKKNISTYKLFFKLGLNSTTYYRIKAGDSITMETLRHICEILECTVTDVVECVPVEEELQKQPTLQN